MRPGYGTDTHKSDKIWTYFTVTESHVENSFTGFIATFPYLPRTFNDNKISIFYYFYLFVILSNK